MLTGNVALAGCRLFEGISGEDLNKMLVCLGCTTESYKKGEVVFSEGTHITKIGILLSGGAMTVKDDFFGNRSIIGTVGVGDVFCEAFAATDTRELPISVIATEDSDVLFVECKRILCTCSNTCAFHRSLIFNFAKNLADENIDCYDKIEVTSKRSTREKLLTYLGIVARAEGKRSFDVPFDRQQLADYLEVDRSGLSAEIGKMVKDGIIKCTKNRFELLI